ncbi:MAG: HEPN domain-containing protein [Victivallaceae bacterium]|nr:HEPN domain-containing protein [Victivallaceae bacterium]
MVFPGRFKVSPVSLSEVRLDIEPAATIFASMKSSIDHLPPDKRVMLERAVATIREMCDDVEMIILFGSHARGDYRDDEDLPPARKSGEASDYDLLAVCRRKSTAKNHWLWHTVAEHCNGRSVEQPFRIIVHDLNYLKQRLKEIHYFFSDIVKEGCLLYTSGKYELKVSKQLAPETQLEIAREHFRRWFENAKNFYFAFEKCFETGRYNTAAFQLHQAAESAYKALLLVHTNYCAQGHFLGNLNDQLRELFPETEDIFPGETEAEKDRLSNFEYAYIGARYDPAFEISQADLEYLAKRVKLLLEMTEKRCIGRLEQLTSREEVPGCSFQQ